MGGGVPAVAVGVVCGTVCAVAVGCGVALVCAAGAAAGGGPQGLGRAAEFGAEAVEFSSSYDTAVLFPAPEPGPIAE